MSTNSHADQAMTDWVKCKINKGMFSDELAVTYPPEGVPQKSVFVPITCVVGEPGANGKVQVRFLQRDEYLMAVLPSASQDIVTVRAEDVVQE